MSIFKTSAAQLASIAAAGILVAQVAPAQAHSITERVSLGPRGVQGNDFSSVGSISARSISADGRFVAFISSAFNLVPGDTNGSYDVFVRDRQTGTTRRVSVGPGSAQGNDSSYEAAISADGRFVAFNSDATNLVSGDTNGFTDVFVRIPPP